MNYLLFDIIWDVESQTKEDCRLPDNVVALNVPNPTADEDLQNNLGVMLSDAFGFNFESFNWKAFNKSDSTHAGGAFYPTNLAII